MARPDSRTLRTLVAAATVAVSLEARAETSVEPQAGAQSEARVEAPVAIPATAVDLCPREGEVVAVITRKREVWLCSGGAPVVRIPVALGQQGLDKRRKGDARTPVGTYALREPRPSGQYGTFIPIDYPTRAQAAQGLSGGTVGIHGPPRGKAEPDYPTTAVDWTLGCVATGTDEDIEVIAEFVRQRRPVVVIL